MTRAIAPVAAEIMALRPPTNEITTAIVNDANRPIAGSTPAMIEKEMASGISASATTRPASTSVRKTFGESSQSGLDMRSLGPADSSEDMQPFLFGRTHLLAGCMRVVLDSTQGAESPAARPRRGPCRMEWQPLRLPVGHHCPEVCGCRRGPVGARALTGPPWLRLYSVAALAKRLYPDVR